ncbi:MAG TPA: hypothetical protein VIM00_14860 [Candidatus Acidoferrum sp.]
MSVRIRHIRILALLLAVIFLGAQFHYCADLSSGPSSSHICPTCSAIGSVVVPQSPGLALGTTVDRLEFVAVVVFFSSDIPHATSPRAPPQL